MKGLLQRGNPAGHLLRGSRPRHPLRPVRHAYRVRLLGLIKDPASTEPEQIDEKPAQRCDANGNAERNQSTEDGRDEARPLVGGHEASVSMPRASRSSSRV